MSLDKPKPFLYKWAENGKRFDVPNNGADTANGKADIQTGFPEITMRSVIQGGVPPWGQDHNGILYKITEAIQWIQAGGYNSYNTELCEAIGGYPQGTILQGNDKNKPWIYWVNIIDNNSIDPNSLKIDEPGVQSGWRRFPTIVDTDGSTLYYTDNGELGIYTAQSSFIFFVSWTYGDDSNDGTRASPLKTISKAISKSPSSGQITIKILDTDDHYILGYNDSFVKDISSYTPGEVYTTDMGVKEEPLQTLAGSIDVGIRKIIIQPYNNSSYVTGEEDNGYDGWDELIKLAGNNTGDAWWGYCLSDEALASLNLSRPRIHKMWCYIYLRNSSGIWSTQNMRYCGFDGVQDSYSVWFLGCRMVTHDLDKLNNAPFNIGSYFERVGGGYMYNGCIIDKLPSVSSFNKGSLGGSDISTTSISFRRQNSFIDAESGTENNSVYVDLNSPITIALSEQQQNMMPGTGYPYIKNTAPTYLKKSSSYTATALGTITQFGVKRYAYLNVNYIIV